MFMKCMLWADSHHEEFQFYDTTVLFSECSEHPLSLEKNVGYVFSRIACYMDHFEFYLEKN